MDDLQNKATEKSTRTYITTFKKTEGVAPINVTTDTYSEIDLPKTDLSNDEINTSDEEKFKICSVGIIMKGQDM